MSFMPAHMTPKLWLRQLYGSKSALDGGVVRRKVADVDRIVGCLAFEADVRRRGFRAVQNGTMYVVFCNHEHLRLIE
jgi:hypothetical protein